MDHLNGCMVGSAIRYSCLNYGFLHFNFPYKDHETKKKLKLEEELHQLSLEIEDKHSSPKVSASSNTAEPHHWFTLAKSNMATMQKQDMLKKVVFLNTFQNKCWIYTNLYSIFEI